MEKWAESNGVESRHILPAQVCSFALYLVSLIQTSSTSSPVITAFYSVKWVHDISDMKSPTDSKIVINVLEAAKRILAKPENKKEPISDEILMSMYKRLYRFRHLKNLRIICICLLGFAGFMRSSEILTIKVADIVFDQTFLQLVLCRVAAI